jgi:hypothetical protein
MFRLGSSLTEVANHSLDRGVHPATADLPWLWHETVHQLSYSSGLLRPGVLYPIWVSEGLATNFESGISSSGEFRSEYRPRTGRLADAFQRGRLLPLKEFISLVRFRPDEGYDLRDVYAQADGLFRFLLMRRPEQLRNYLASLSQLEPGSRSSDELHTEFVQSFGSIEKAETDWTNFVRESIRVE